MADLNEIKQRLAELLMKFFKDYEEEHRTQQFRFLQNINTEQGFQDIANDIPEEVAEDILNEYDAHRQGYGAVSEETAFLNAYQKHGNNIETINQYKMLLNYIEEGTKTLPTLETNEERDKQLNSIKNFVEIMKKGIRNMAENTPPIYDKKLVELSAKLDNAMTSLTLHKSDYNLVHNLVDDFKYTENHLLASLVKETSDRSYNNYVEATFNQINKMEESLKNKAMAKLANEYLDAEQQKAINLVTYTIEEIYNTLQGFKGSDKLVMSDNLKQDLINEFKKSPNDAFNKTTDMFKYQELIKSFKADVEKLSRLPDDEREKQIQSGVLDFQYKQGTSLANNYTNYANMNKEFKEWFDNQPLFDRFKQKDNDLIQTLKDTYKTEIQKYSSIMKEAMLKKDPQIAKDGFNSMKKVIAPIIREIEETPELMTDENQKLLDKTYFNLLKGYNQVCYSFPEDTNYKSLTEIIPKDAESFSKSEDYNRFKHLLSASTPVFSMNKTEQDLQFAAKMVNYMELSTKTLNDSFLKLQEESKKPEWNSLNNEQKIDKLESVRHKMVYTLTLIGIGQPENDYQKRYYDLYRNRKDKIVDTLITNYCSVANQIVKDCCKEPTPENKDFFKKEILNGGEQKPSFLDMDKVKASIEKQTETKENKQDLAVYDLINNHLAKADMISNGYDLEKATGQEEFKHNQDVQKWFAEARTIRNEVVEQLAQIILVRDETQDPQEKAKLTRTIDSVENALVNMYKEGNNTLYKSHIEYGLQSVYTQNMANHFKGNLDSIAKKAANELQKEDIDIDRE